jgi:NAD(P)-dependent dehydrogenase (short-subunit alcohol dehydrogenase family)
MSWLTVDFARGLRRSSTLLCNQLRPDIALIPIRDMPSSEVAVIWRAAGEVETKVLGYLRCARAVAPHMVAQGWGRIVNVSGLNARSTGSLVGSVRNVAVAAMTKNLADELGPSGVNVTVVHPRATVTERTQQLLAGLAARDGTTPEETAARFAADTSIGRMVTAAEVADVVAFLASPRSVAITGDAIAVGGGTRGAIHY